MSRARRGRGGIVLLAVVMVLAGFAFAADAMARITVERRASEALAMELPSSSPLDVSIGGWPFLAFLVTDRVDSVRVTGSDLTLTHDGRTVTLAAVDATATGVSNPMALADAVVDRVDLVGVVSWADVSREVGAEVGYAGDGRLQATETIDILGQDLDVVFSAVPGVTADTQRFTLTDPTAVIGPLTTTAGLLDSLVRQLAADFVLPSLEGLTYQSIRATETGLEVVMTGESVSVASLR